MDLNDTALKQSDQAKAKKQSIAGVTEKIMFEKICEKLNQDKELLKIIYALISSYNR